MKYLGQQNKPLRIKEQIIEDKLFENIKSKLYKIRFLTRLRVFKTYMITKAAYHNIELLAQRMLEYIRRIIFRGLWHLM